MLDDAGTIVPSNAAMHPVMIAHDAIAIVVLIMFMFALSLSIVKVFMSFGHLSHPSSPQSMMVQSHRACQE